MPEVSVLPETALLWAGVSASACAHGKQRSEEASLSAMAEAEVSSAGGAIGRAAALGGTCRGADGLHGDDAGQVGQCIQGQLTADELGKFGIRDGDHLPRAAFGFQDGLIQRSRAGLDVIAHRHEPEADHGSQDRAHSQKHELKKFVSLHIRYFLISPGSP